MLPKRPVRDLVGDQITGWLPREDLVWLRAEQRRIRYPTAIRKHPDKDRYALCYTSQKRPLSHTGTIKQSSAVSGWMGCPDT